MSAFSRLCLAGIVLLFVCAALLLNAPAGYARPGLDSAAMLALSAILLCLAAWFLHAFVFTPLDDGKGASRAALNGVFGFAYTFAFVALAMLMTPYAGGLESGALPNAGPIRLVLGCVKRDSPADALNQTARRLAAAPASASAPRAGASAPEEAPSAAAFGGSPTIASHVTPSCGESLDTYTVLVALGGVIAREQHLPSAAAAASAPAPRSRTVYAISDGVVVPLSMAILATLGGTLNLLRRLPELQKRADPSFAGTSREPALLPSEAREFVVFQVLQLITAPFLALVAHHGIQPNSLPAAVALAFVSGFFSEAVLLRLRAFVEGPERTPVMSTSASVLMGEIRVHARSLAGVAGSLELSGPGVSFSCPLTAGSAHASVKGLHAGSYTVRLIPTAPGVKPTVQQVSLAQGQTLSLTL